MLASCRHELPPLHALTVDHGLRPESASEARRARAFAAALGVPHRTHRVELARPSETAARTARYAVFRREAAAHDAAALLLAHHADDQLETVLLRMIRGTGPFGLCGMPARRALEDGATARAASRCQVLRPLLSERPQLLRQWLHHHEWTWVEDASNQDPDWTRRNRMRGSILPRLRRHDPDDRALRGLVREARALRRAVRREVADYDAKWPRGASVDLSRIPLARDVSPWGRECIALRALESLGQRRPTRHLARRLAALIGPEGRTGTRTESRGRWTATRHRDHVHIAAQSSGVALP